MDYYIKWLKENCTRRKKIPLLRLLPWIRKIKWEYLTPIPNFIPKEQHCTVQGIKKGEHRMGRLIQLSDHPRNKNERILTEMIDEIDDLVFLRHVRFEMSKKMISDASKIYRDLYIHDKSFNMPYDQFLSELQVRSKELARRVIEGSPSPYPDEGIYLKTIFNTSS